MIKTFTTDIAPSFVTDGAGNYLVQLPDENQWGFLLADDDQTWPGGFGSGMSSWVAVPVENVPGEDRERLEWLLNDFDPTDL